MKFSVSSVISGVGNFFFAGWRFIKRRWLWFVILGLIVAGGGFWQYRKQQAAKPILVFEKPEVGNLTKTLQVSGIVDAKEKALLRFAAGGKVVKVGAETGDWVNKGQVIATIDAQELNKRLQKDLNAYMRERWDWETTQDNTDYNVETLQTRKQIDKEQWDLNDTVLDVEIRDISISNTVLKAPFSGILVSAPTTTPGVQLLATEGFEIVNPESLVFKARVDEADVGKIKAQQSASILLDAFPEQPFTSAVNSVEYKSSQSTTGTVFVVELPLQTMDGLRSVRLGMNGDATITLETRENVMSIPLDAVKTRDDKFYVQVRTGKDTTEEREITTDLETDDRIEVIKGLKPDDEILMPS